MRKREVIHLIIMMLLAAGTKLTAQEVFPHQVGNMIVVDYDLEQDAMCVELSVSTDGGRTYTLLRCVSGDIENVKAGRNKSIRWDVMKEFGEVEGELRFKVTKYLKKYFADETFVILNGACSTAGIPSFGASFGMAKHWGWYVSVMTGLGFGSLSPIAYCDADGYADGHRPFYSGKAASRRLSLTAGGVLRLADAVGLRLGAGYGFTEYCYETVEHQWIGAEKHCVSGLDASLGVQCRLGSIVLSAEAVTTGFKTLEAKMGAGFAF